MRPEVDGGTHDLGNLQPLCAPPAGAGCHRAKTAREARARALARRAGTARARRRRVPVARIAVTAAAWCCCAALWWAWLDLTGQVGAEAAWVGQARAVLVALTIAQLSPAAYRWLAVFPAGNTAPAATAATPRAEVTRIVEAARTVLGDKGVVTVTVVEETP